VARVREAARLSLPDAILDDIAARPGDLGAWQVLTDLLLETEDPAAQLALCELELMKGISNPDLLETLARERAARPKLPHEPSWGGFEAQWRCGFLVKLVLDLAPDAGRYAETLGAQRARTLHHLLLQVREPQLFGVATGEPRHVGPALAQVLGGAKGVRRLSLDARSATDQTALLGHLLGAVPPKLGWLDLKLGALHESLDAVLVELVRRVPLVSFDGTSLAAHVGLAEQLVAAGQRVVLGGTGLSPQTAPFVKDWLAPDATHWLEREADGVVVPLTPHARADGFDCPAWPEVMAGLKRDLLGWSWFNRPVEDGQVLQFSNGRAVFRQR